MYTQGCKITKRITKIDFCFRFFTTVRVGLINKSKYQHMITDKNYSELPPDDHTQLTWLATDNSYKATDHVSNVTTQTQIDNITTLFRINPGEMPKISTDTCLTIYTMLTAFQDPIDKNVLELPSTTTKLVHFTLVISKADFLTENETDFDTPNIEKSRQSDTAYIFSTE